MRCECCDAELSDVDATARFTESGNFVGMCKACRRFLPKNIGVTVRTDLEPVKEKYPEDSYENEDAFWEWVNKEIHRGVGDDDE